MHPYSILSTLGSQRSLFSADTINIWLSKHPMNGQWNESFDACTTLQVSHSDRQVSFLPLCVADTWACNNHQHVPFRYVLCYKLPQLGLFHASLRPLISWLSLWLASTVHKLYHASCRKDSHQPHTPPSCRLIRQRQSYSGSSLET